MYSREKKGGGKKNLTRERKEFITDRTGDKSVFDKLSQLIVIYIYTYSIDSYLENLSRLMRGNEYSRDYGN